MRLRPLLRLLISNPEFRSSPKIVDMDGIGSARACDLFVPFKNISAQHERIFMGVFGRIVSDQYFPQDHAVWLNSDRCFGPSIRVPVELVALLMDRFEIKDVAYFANANVLVFAPCESHSMEKSTSCWKIHTISWAILTGFNEVS